MPSPLRRSLAVAVVLPAGLMLAGCGSGDDESLGDVLTSARSTETPSASDPSEDASRAPSKSPRPKPSKSKSTEPTSGPDDGAATSDAPNGGGGGDTSVTDELASRGVDASLIRELGAVADRTGYGISPSTPLSFEQAQDFAVAVVLGVCDPVAEGYMTWADSIAEDLASGAPPSAARQMNNYLRDSFCPQVS